MPLFLFVCSTSLFENTVGKSEIARNEQFLFSHCVFYPFGELFSYFHQIQKCHLQSLTDWKSIKFVIWERVFLRGQNLRLCCKGLAIHPCAGKFTKTSVWDGVFFSKTLLLCE